MDPVRVAVIGLGYWGPNLVRNLFELESADLVLVCDQRAEAVEQVRRRYPSVRGTTSLDDVLEDPTVEAVVVATPIRTHLELARASLGAGKHTLVEKPLADSIAGAASWRASHASGISCWCPATRSSTALPSRPCRR